MSELAIAGFGGLDDEQQVFDKEEDVQQQQLRTDTVAEMDAMPSLFMRIMLSSLFGLACQTLQTIFTAMLATFLGVCALLRSHSSSSKGGHSRATRTTIDDGVSSSSRICALLRSYRYLVASAASQPLLFLVVALACIVPAAEAGCNQVDSCGDCNDKSCPGGQQHSCSCSNCAFCWSKRE